MPRADRGVRGVARAEAAEGGAAVAGETDVGARGGRRADGMDPSVDRVGGVVIANDSRGDPRGDLPGTSGEEIRGVEPRGDLPPAFTRGDGVVRPGDRTLLASESGATATVSESRVPAGVLAFVLLRTSAGAKYVHVLETGSTSHCGVTAPTLAEVPVRCREPVCVTDRRPEIGV